MAFVKLGFFAVRTLIYNNTFCSPKTLRVVFSQYDMCVNENALFCYFVEYLRHCSATLNGTFIHTNHSFHHCPKFPPKGSSRSQIASLKHFLKWPWLCHNALVREKWSIVINWWQNFHSFSSFMPLSG